MSSPRQRRQWLCLAAALVLAASVAASRPSGAPAARLLSDEALEAIHGAGGGGGGGGTPSITFESAKVFALSTAGATVTHRFTAPTSGPNTVASFRVEDDVPPASAGHYIIEVRVTSSGTLVASASGTTPVLLQDVALSGAAQYDVKVIEDGGSVARLGRLTMSPRYTASPTALSFNNSQTAYLTTTGIHTYSIDVDSSAKLGRADIFFDDTSISGGSSPDNVITLVGPDHVTVKAKGQELNDVSLDNSVYPSLAFGATGTHLVIVSNTSVTAAGYYTAYLGPYPGQDDTAPCEVITNPTFTTPSSTPNRQLLGIGDRDCFSFDVAPGATEVTLDLVQLSGSTYNNEVILLDSAENTIQAKKGQGSVTLTAAVDADGGAYKFEVNNLEDGFPTYRVDVSMSGPCVGGTCTLVTGGPGVKFQPPNNVDWSPEVPIVRPGPTTLPNPANATIYLDRSGSGTYTIQVLGDGGSSAPPLCSATGNTDLLLENCDLSTTSGVPTVRVKSSTGYAAVVRVSTELLGKSMPTVSNTGVLNPGELEGLGDEDFYQIGPIGSGQLGIGMDDRIGPDKAQVRICLMSDLLGCIAANPAVIIRSTESSGDVGQQAIDVAAGTYVAIVDNISTGDGQYDVCFGPGDSSSDEEKDPTNNSFAVVGNLAPSAAPLTKSGFMACGDTDKWPLTLDTEQTVTIEAKETAAIPGQIQMDIVRNVAGIDQVGICDTSNSNVVACSKASTRATVSSVNLAAGTSYLIRVDHQHHGSGAYTVKVGDPNATF